MIRFRHRRKEEQTDSSGCLSQDSSYHLHIETFIFSLFFFGLSPSHTGVSVKRLYDLSWLWMLSHTLAESYLNALLCVNKALLKHCGMNRSHTRPPVTGIERKSSVFTVTMTTSEISVVIF